MHPIREVDVGMAGRSEHDLGARGSAAALRVGRQVVGTEVGLGLDQAAPPPAAIVLPNQDLAEQVARDGGGLPVEERRVEDLPCWGNQLRRELRQASS